MIGVMNNGTLVAMDEVAIEIVLPRRIAISSVAIPIISHRLLGEHLRGRGAMGASKVSFRFQR
jgi:hypothetical protein